MAIFGVDSADDRLRIRALRALPPGRARDDDRRGVFTAALGQFDELLDAAAAVGPASRPLPLYYALNQAGRAIAAALMPADRPWRPILHGLSIRDPEGGHLQSTPIIRQRGVCDERPGSFQVLAEATRAFSAPSLAPEVAPLAKATMLANVWASIPLLDSPGLGAGCPRALPLEFDTTSPAPVFGQLRHLDWIPADEAWKSRLHEYLAKTYPASSEGLTVESVSHDEGHGAAAAQAELSWKSPDGTRRTVYTATSGYLTHKSRWLIPALSSGDTLPPILLWWCLLQALSSLARYHPSEWTAALDPDRSQWAVSIEKVLRTGLDVVPRLVLQALSPAAAAE